MHSIVVDLLHTERLVARLPGMNFLMEGFDYLIFFLRPVVFGIAAVTAVVCAGDWLVRTKRINPFNPIARFMRQRVDPLMAPIERSVVRAGGLPSSAPLWSLVAVVIGGIVVLSLLAFLRDQFASLAVAGQRGTRGLATVIFAWAFGFLRLALIVRVVSSWIRVSAYSKWVRWSFTITEPMLAPLRRVLPPLGMIDVSPIVAYLGIGLLQWAVFGLI
jgi:YggT family protein